MKVKLPILLSNTVCMLFAFSLGALEDHVCNIIIRGNCTVSDLMGTQFSSFQLDDAEDHLLNQILIPAMKYDYDKVREALRGAYVLLPDQGKLFQEIIAYLDCSIAVPKRYEEVPSYVGELATLGKLKIGSKDNASWFRLDASKNPVHLLYNFKDYSSSLFKGAKTSYGPFGTSNYTALNPLELLYEEELEDQSKTQVQDLCEPDPVQVSGPPPLHAAAISAAALPVALQPNLELSLGNIEPHSVALAVLVPGAERSAICLNNAITRAGSRERMTMALLAVAATEV